MSKKEPISSSPAEHYRPRGNRRLKAYRRFSGIILIITVLLVFGVFAFFYLQKINNREKLANFLPADRAIALLEYNFDSARPETATLKSLAAQNPAFQSGLESLMAYIPYHEQFDQWYSGRGGLALLADSSGQKMQMALFLQEKDHSKLLEWINELILDSKNDAILDENYFGQKLISFRSGQTYNLLLSGSYLIIAEERETLKTIAETAAGQIPSLRSATLYNQAASALPEQNLIFFFLERGKLLNILGRNEQFLAGRLAALKLYFPFLKLFSAEAVSVQIERGAADSPKLVARHLSFFDQQQLKDKRLFQTDYFYNIQLDRFSPDQSLLTVGGVNLLDQKNKLQSYFGAQTNLNNLLLEGLIQNFADQIGTPKDKLDLNKDFFPLFQKSYLLSLSDSGKVIPDFLLILESDNPQNDLNKLQNLLTPVGLKVASQIEAKPQPITLPDGTTGSELRADLAPPRVERATISGKNISVLNFSNDFQIHLYSDNSKNRLLATTSVQSLESYLNGEPKQKNYQYNLDKPTEVYRLNLEELAEVIPGLTSFKPLSHISIARKFTELGILSTYQLEF